jgi:hypothetical protein
MCSGILRAEEVFSVEDACQCSSIRGQKARSVALQSAEDELGGSARPADLRELLSDGGTIW